MDPRKAQSIVQWATPTSRCEGRRLRGWPTTTAASRRHLPKRQSHLRRLAARRRVLGGPLLFIALAGSATGGADRGRGQGLAGSSAGRVPATAGESRRAGGGPGGAGRADPGREGGRDRDHDSAPATGPGGGPLRRPLPLAHSYPGGGGGLRWLTSLSSIPTRSAAYDASVAAEFTFGRITRDAARRGGSDRTGKARQSSNLPTLRKVGGFCCPVVSSAVAGSEVDRLRIPAGGGLRAQLLRECHDGPLGGHFGRAKTGSLERRLAFWGGTAPQRRRVGATRRRTKSEYGGPRALLHHLPLPSRRGGTIGMGWVAGLPTKGAGFDVIHERVDLLSGKVPVAPTRSTARVTDAAAPLSPLHSRHVPAVGRRLSRRSWWTWLQLVKSMGSRLVVGSAYHKSNH